MSLLQKLMAIGAAGLLAVFVTSASASSQGPTRSLLKLHQLPAGWTADPSASVGFLPPCLAAALAPLAKFPEARMASIGESHDLAQLTERVVAVPRGARNARYSEALSRFAACNGSSWKRGMKFDLLIAKRTVPMIGKIEITGFSVIISSPSKNVEPNPYPGLVDFALVGNKVVLVSMMFAGIPVDTATFDAIEGKALADAAG